MFHQWTCSARLLGEERLHEAMHAAIAENPANAPPRPPRPPFPDFDRDAVPPIPVVPSRYWRTGGVRLTVGFLDAPPRDLRARILMHMNLWGQNANVAFVESQDDAQVRIARDDSGCWSYIGTDILLIDRNRPTTNLVGLTMNTPDEEVGRMVRHQAGHLLGCPHENLRADLIALIDSDKAITYYGHVRGWSAERVTAEILTPIEQRSVLSTPAGMTSIMCHQIPGSLTKIGRPIIGNAEITESDHAFVGRLYPKR